MSLIHPADLICPRHLREAAEQGVSGIELALAVARYFNRMAEYRQDDPGEAAFWARYCCERISREDLDRAWRKAYKPPSPVEKPDRKRVKVPTTPIWWDKAWQPDAVHGEQLVRKAGSIKAALHRHHPDHGGQPRDFMDVDAYRKESQL